MKLVKHAISSNRNYVKTKIEKFRLYRKFLQTLSLPNTAKILAKMHAI